MSADDTPVLAAVVAFPDETTAEDARARFGGDVRSHVVGGRRVWVLTLRGLDAELYAATGDQSAAWQVEHDTDDAA